MKKISLLALLSSCILLSACSKMPSECEESWKHVEKLAKESGIPDDAIKVQKKEFEKQIEKLPKQQAIETCAAQSSAFGFIK